MKKIGIIVLLLMIVCTVYGQWEYKTFSQEHKEIKECNGTYLVQKITGSFSSPKVEDKELNVQIVIYFHEVYEKYKVFFELYEYGQERVMNERYEYDRSPARIKYKTNVVDYNNEIHSFNSTMHIDRIDDIKNKFIELIKSNNNEILKVEFKRAVGFEEYYKYNFKINTNGFETNLKKLTEPN